MDAAEAHMAEEPHAPGRWQSLVDSGALSRDDSESEAEAEAGAGEASSARGDGSEVETDISPEASHALSDSFDDDDDAARLPTAAELLGLASVDELRAAGGAPVQHQLDWDRLVELCYDGWSNGEMAEELDVPVRVVKARKKQLGLVGLAQRPWLPDLETLQRWWQLNPGITVAQLALELGVSPMTLGRHMRRVGFTKPRTGPSDEEVRVVVAEVATRKYASNNGLTYMEGLFFYRGIPASKGQIRRAIALVDPQGRRQRAAKTAKPKRPYRVAGPRSLYHADAHEKLAKTYGIWLHLLIDGFSRFVIYLAARPNKFSETVRSLYVEACEAVGWPSRCRWDKGTENNGARLEQTAYWQQRRTDWATRGSALTGRSVQNLRAEYVWVPVHAKVSGPYRARFDAMAMKGWLDPNSEVDLFCLHTVFMRLVQQACDVFVRELWNARRIRGPSGGRPMELFHSSIGSEALLDDERYSQQGFLYGQEDPSGPDPGEDAMSVSTLRTIDPLAGMDALLSVRAAYLVGFPLGGDDAGEDDYLRYKMVCAELVTAHEDFRSEEASYDWAGFSTSQPVYAISCRLSLRWELSRIALELEAQGR